MLVSMFAPFGNSPRETNAFRWLTASAKLCRSSRGIRAARLEFYGRRGCKASIGREIAAARGTRRGVWVGRSPLPFASRASTALRSGDFGRSCSFGPIPVEGEGDEREIAWRRTRAQHNSGCVRCRLFGV